MKEKERLAFRKGDGIAIAAVTLIAAGMMAFFLLSAGETAKTVGSSITISAPAITACVALVNLSRTAISPLWVKLPLIITTKASGLTISFIFSIWFKCPL